MTVEQIAPKDILNQMQELIKRDGFAIHGYDAEDIAHVYTVGLSERLGAELYVQFHVSNRKYPYIQILKNTADVFMEQGSITPGQRVFRQVFMNPISVSVVELDLKSDQIQNIKVRAGSFNRVFELQF
ncbi:MAG: hypothetical protein [Bacteriophage sp.]|nr:MAG: hypothetical protein [Bacteriophage sp.]